MLRVVPLLAFLGSACGQVSVTSPFPTTVLGPHPELHGLTILENQKFTATAPNTATQTGISNWATAWCDAMVQWTAGNKSPWYALWDQTSPTVSLHDWGEGDTAYVGWSALQAAADHILPPVTTANPAGIYYSQDDPYKATVVFNFTLPNGAKVQFMDYITFSPSFLVHTLEVYLYFFNRPTMPPSKGTQGNAFASAYAASLLTYGGGNTYDYTTLYSPTTAALLAANTPPTANTLAGIVVENTHYSANVSNGASIKFGVQMAMTERGTNFDHPWPTYKELHVLTLVDPSSTTCLSWCNVHTCTMSSCSSCSTCTAMDSGRHCSSWCNSWTCGISYCSGCGVC